MSNTWLTTRFLVRITILCRLNWSEYRNAHSITRCGTLTNLSGATAPIVKRTEVIRCNLGENEWPAYSKPSRWYGTCLVRCGWKWQWQTNNSGSKRSWNRRSSFRLHYFHRICHLTPLYALYHRDVPTSIRYEINNFHFISIREFAFSLHSIM